LYAGANPTRYFDPDGRFYVTEDTGPTDESDGGGVFCDGVGGLETRLFGEWDDCIKDCVIVHEQSHLSDITARQPSICAGTKAKRRIGSSSGEEQRWTERRAYMAELENWSALSGNLNSWTAAATASGSYATA
jgi:hypothetical protein